MILLRTITIVPAFFIYIQVCHADECKIRGLDSEDLKNLSYDPPRPELLSSELDKKAWQHFVDTYETPVNKVQDWYNSIVDKNSADAAADSFNKDVLPVLKKLTGYTADMKKQVLAIPASPEIQKLILQRILKLQGRLLMIFLPMQNEENADESIIYHGSSKLFEVICGVSSPSTIVISKFIESRNEPIKNVENTFKEPWNASTCP